jgi:hypothetical protein
VAPLVPVVIGCVVVVGEAAGLLLSADPHATQDSKTLSVRNAPLIGMLLSLFTRLLFCLLAVTFGDCFLFRSFCAR